MAASACFKQSSLFALLVSSAVLLLPTSWRWLSTSSFCPGKHAGAGVAHLHFFMHDVLTGPNTTAVNIVNGTGPLFNGMPLRFGQVVVIDDVLTEGSSPTSSPVGRTQGFYIFSSMEAPALLFSMNVVLTAGPYKGSTVTITGRDHIMEPLRELSVVGGTGRFRMATGYALWKTASWQFLENAILELDVYVHMNPVAYAGTPLSDTTRR